MCTCFSFVTQANELCCTVYIRTAAGPRQEIFRRLVGESYVAAASLLLCGGKYISSGVSR